MASEKPDWLPLYHNPTIRKLELLDYFTGPRDIHRYSKWPLFMRMHGSILPRMIVPLALVGTWSTIITVIYQYVWNIGVSPVLLTMTGFVIGMSLGFRSTTAYERYMDGRKYWAQLHLTSRNLSRIIWIHVQERHKESAELGRSDVLHKLGALNLINAFAVALKHRLRFEPSVEYPDLAPLVAHLDTFAGNADQSKLQHRKHSKLRSLGEYLGLPFAQSNPSKLVHESKENLGNTPLEILNYLADYLEVVIQNKTLSVGGHQGQYLTQLGSLAEVLTGTERVVSTPLPVAYSISIAQITWAWVTVLPFQLVQPLGWATIPGAMAGAYMVLGLAQIGHELEDPFGHDVNDLPLDHYCQEIANDIDALTSAPPPDCERWLVARDAHVLHPVNPAGYKYWAQRSMPEIRAALRAKALSRDVKRERLNSIVQSDDLVQSDGSRSPKSV